MHQRMHMCGISNITAIQQPDGGCQEGVFQTKEGNQLEGTFCECWTNACNHSSSLYSKLFETYWLIIKTHLVLMIMYDYLRSNFFYIQDIF